MSPESQTTQAEKRESSNNKALVIVESPTKARTITKFLGSNYIVKASMGHIRDLPDGAKDIPENLKKEPWARLGVNISSDFTPLYVIPNQKKAQVKALKDAMRQANEIYLATDEDREGESISWHILEALKPKIPTKRLVFHEITKDAIKKALDNPRSINENLVRAQETRRIVDRLFGYEVSPLLWKKMARGLSAGRVQSVAIRLLVERERERTRFVKATYWGLKASFSKNSQSFDAELYQLGAQRLATGKDFDPANGKIKETEKNILALGETEARELLARLATAQAVVSNIEEKPYTSSPPAPFVTSSLQQEANAKLRFSAKYTMNIAQQLYENGFITYMRTDSTTLSAEALNAARGLIARDYGAEYLPSSPRVYSTQVRNAQEAHEAIRPAGENFASLEQVKTALGGDAYKLYELIWKRTVASQMQNARGTTVSVNIDIEDAKFRASGRTIEFPGYLRAYVEGSEDPDSELAEKDKVLPKMANGDELKTDKLEPLERSTQAPARFTEGSLIKELERLGIGRPSTWASIVELVLSRSYAFKKGTALVPTFTAVALVGLLEKHFSNIMDYKFTASLEDELDAIARGELANLDYLRSFYFGNGYPGLKTLVEKGESDIDPREVCGIALGSREDGTAVEVRIGKYGPFLTDGTKRSSLPESLTLEELTLSKASEILNSSADGQEALGIDPISGEAVYVKSGRFGPYVQLGEMKGETKDEQQKPKMASLLPGMKPESVTLELALEILSLPRTLGTNESEQEIIAANGRYGPYIRCGEETRSIPAELSPLSISKEQALELLAQPRVRGRQAAQPKSLKEVGLHPESQAKLVVLSGRYGPYVTDGTINASLPRGTNPEALTVEEAVSLLQARAEKIAADGGVSKPKKSRASKASSKKTGTKAGAAKKSTAKTKATKA